MAVECYIIPKGQEKNFERQFGKLNKIKPIELSTGDFIIPINVAEHLNKTYTDLKSQPERRYKRKDINSTGIEFAEATIKDLKKLSKGFIEPGDLHDKHKKE